MTRTGGSLGPRLVIPGLVPQASSWCAMLAHGTTWRGDWMNAVDQAAGTVVITGPLLAALVANEYSRRGDTSLPALAVSGAHPLQAWYRPVAVLVLLAWANLVLVLGEAAVLTRIVGVPVSVRPFEVLPLSAVVLVGHAVVGMAFGLRLSPRLAGVVAGAVSFGLFLLAVAHLAPASFNGAAASGDLVGQQYRSSTVLALALIALVTAIAIGATTVWGTGWRRGFGGLAVLCAIAAMALSNGGFVDVDRRYVAAPGSLLCRGSAPAVCLPAEAPRSLAAASRRIHQFAAPLVAAEVALPTRWTYYWGQPSFPSGGVLTMLSGRVLDAGASVSDVVSSLAVPALCAGFFADASREQERALDVRLLLERWIGFRNGLGYGVGVIDVPRAWFSSSESEAWVRTTYAQLRRCDLAAVRPPSR